MESIPSDFTKAARHALDCAAQEAARRAAGAIEPEHLLLAILKAHNSLAAKALTDLRLAPDQLCDALTSRLSSATPVSTTPAFGEELKLVMHYARKEAAHLGHYQIDALHLLLGLLYLDHGVVADLFRVHELSLYDLRQSVMQQPRRFSSPPLPSLRGVIRPSPIFLIPLGMMLLGGIGLYFGAARPLIQPLTILFILGGWVTSVCIHEFGHALAAYLGGDESVKAAGYLSFNPLKYSHPYLSIILPIVFLLAGGLGLPGGAVYVNRLALRSKRWETWTSAGGPLGTLLFGALVSWPFFLDWTAWVTRQNFPFWSALALLAFLQVTALVFNLLPIPPLDGFGLLAPWLSWEVRQRAYMFGNVTLMLLFVVLWQESPLTHAFWSNMYGVADLLNIPLDLVAVGFDHFFG